MKRSKSRYEQSLRITAYTVITELLASANLITKDEKRKIEKFVSNLKDEQIMPEETQHSHSRNQMISHE